LEVLEVQKSEDRSQKAEVQKAEVQESEVQKSEVQKSRSPVITISRRRGVGIPADENSQCSPTKTASVAHDETASVAPDETASVVAGLVPATSRIAIP
jgi:hypothetical protein